MATENVAESSKWVTFHDAMDDAMEGGKLRRNSWGAPFSGASYSSSVCSSNGDFSDQASSPNQKKNSFDFSQSLGYREDQEIQERRKPQRSETLASLQSSLVKITVFLRPFYDIKFLVFAKRKNL